MRVIIVVITLLHEYFLLHRDCILQLVGDFLLQRGCILMMFCWYSDDGVTCHVTLPKWRELRGVVGGLVDVASVLSSREVWSCLMSSARGAGRGGMLNAAARCGRGVVTACLRALNSILVCSVCSSPPRRSAVCRCEP